MRRMMLSMTQEKLAHALGLTFQQVQKYEKGANRVGASRLHQLSHILEVPVSYFFEGAPAGQRPIEPSNSPALDFVAEFLSTAEGLALTRAFTRIKDPQMRRSIVSLVETIVDGDDPAALASELAQTRHVCS